MTFLLDFLISMGGIVTICIVVWEVYIAARWAAEDVIEPAFWWLNDRVLRMYAWFVTEEWYMWQEWQEKDEP